ncbi:c-type cytochrome [Glaciecola sp. 1036]|uniref:c-type cytochrome n=1 Tax=Alteromonadaceae TaxID=72275 RepID=UPI003D032EEF
MKANAESKTEIQPIPEQLQYCTVCHGSQFKGDFATQAPNLTGLPAWYLAKQLNAFMNKERGVHAEDVSGHEMRAAAEALTPELIQLAVSTITKLPNTTKKPLSDWQQMVFKQEEPIEISLQNGKKLFTTCASCHGENAQGNQSLNAPPLVGRNNWYIAKQLNNFKHGIRGDNQSDIAGQQMRAAANVLTTKQDIVDVVSYIEQLK